MKPWNRLLLPAVLAFALPGALLAQTESYPSAGTWVLNLAKSSYKPGPAPQSETRTYEATADGMHRVTVHQVTATGAALTETGTYKSDGKSYAFTGSPNVDALEVTEVNDRLAHTKLMRDGKMIGRLTHTLSNDGKTLTLTVTLRTASGKTEHEVRVYDRQ